MNRRRRHGKRVGLGLIAQSGQRDTTYFLDERSEPQTPRYMPEPMARQGCKGFHIATELYVRE